MLVRPGGRATEDATVTVTIERDAAPAAAPTPQARRPEIEGLRTVASLLVVGFHVFLGRAAGGVDVFLLVAGFLATETLLRHLDDGRIRPLEYLARTAARLLPLALTVLVFVALAVTIDTNQGPAALGFAVLASALALYSIRSGRRVHGGAVVMVVLALGGLALSVAVPAPWFARSDLGQVAASALFHENRVLDQADVRYLHPGEAMSPVQHYWSLSLLGQFHLLWLALFGVVGLAPRPLRRPLAVIGVALAFAVSLAHSIELTAANQPAAYFSPKSRLFEFALGGLLSLVLASVDALSDRFRRVAGWSGLALILSCGAILPVATTFPGWIALWPIGGASLLIASAHRGGTAPGGTAARLLSTPALARLGSYSYGLYLWHWPILVIYRAQYGQSGVPFLPGLALILGTFLLAYLSTTFIEAPIRAALRRRRPTTVLALAAASVFAVAGLAWGLATHPTIDLGTPNRRTIDMAVAARLADAYDDLPHEIADGCNQEGWGTEVRWCSYGDAEAPFDVVLVGNSHAGQLFPAVKEVARRHGWHLDVATHDGCAFTAEPSGGGSVTVACATWNNAVMQRLAADPPDLVVTIASHSGEAGEEVPAGYVDAWRRLDQLDVAVVAIRDTPRWRSDPLRCLWANTTRPERCSTARAYALSDVAPTVGLDAPNNTTFVDLTDRICPTRRCPGMVDGVVRFRDQDHLTATFAATLADPLDDPLVEGVLQR